MIEKTQHTTTTQNVKIYESREAVSTYVAQRIATVIKAKQQTGEKAVLGLATGSTPKGVYKELVRLHREEGLSFHNVVTFNLDEYYPMQPTNQQSYVYFMNQQLFDHIDLPRAQIHIPNGAIARDEITTYCATYEQQIAALGGLDLQILGIGRTGHIGFNEPGSTLDSTTRLVALNDLTRMDGIADFGGKEFVPTHAITMGVQTITEAKEIILMALTGRKAEIVQKTLEGEITAAVPATFLRAYAHVEYVLDAEAASLLK